MMPRTHGGLGLVAVLVASLLLALSGLAEEQERGPAFDCARASGTVEKLICADEEIAALDRKLESVYKAAMIKAKDGLPDTLRAEQRGWVKGRDECWKATSVTECVRGEYRLRISELQVQWRLAPEKKPVFFGCENNPANEVVVTFFDTDPPTARLERGDRTVIAWQVPSASGAKYEGQKVTFWNKGDEALVTWLGTELKCRAK